MNYLNKEQIISINKAQIEIFGGNYVTPFNFLNEQRIDYLLEIIDAEMFGQPLYPEVYQKAGLYMFNIIANHIFTDGNKRTGLHSAIIFLLNNKFKIDSEFTEQQLIEYATEVASGEHTLETVQDWFKNNIIKI